MTGSNHVVTGALVAAVVHQPQLAIPLAFLSHFVLDALPHYGDNSDHSWLRTHFDKVLIVDACITTAFLVTLAMTQPAHWLLMIICGLVAVSPDILWLPYYIADRKGNPKEHGPVSRLFKWIQWGERPWGIYIEFVFFFVILSALTNHM